MQNVRKKICVASLLPFLMAAFVAAQSGRVGNYSEGVSKLRSRPPAEPQAADDQTIRVETDLVIVPVRITSNERRPVTDLKQTEFRIFEDGEQQAISYFSASDQPFTVVLMLDMSYSTVFKLDQIQAAAMLFVSKLREFDKIAIIAFDGKPRLLCRPTNDRYALRLAIESTSTGDGTSVYDAMDLALRTELQSIPGRKALVLLSDGVDTMSGKTSAKQILGSLTEAEMLVYSLRYDTFGDVRKNRRNNAEIRYDDDDRPYIFEVPPKKGERESDYTAAREFLESAAEISGGKVFKVSDTTNLNAAFEQIADELRKTYSLGYYPSTERRPGVTHTLKVRVYRPGLNIRLR